MSPLALVALAFVIAVVLLVAVAVAAGAMSARIERRLDRYDAEVIERADRP